MTTVTTESSVPKTEQAFLSNRGGQVIPFPGGKAFELVQIEPGTWAQIQNRPGTSKSMARAMQCPDYFARQYMQPGEDRDSLLSLNGTHFHEYRRTYLRHLAAEQKPDDAAWRLAYSQQHDELSEDCRAWIIEDDFKVIPEEILAIETFFSVDFHFKRLEMDDKRKPGGRSYRPDALAWGTPDLVLLDWAGTHATIRDWKTGWSTSSVTDDEPIYYVALVFAHFPRVQKITFIWDFERYNMYRTVEYDRAKDYEWIQSRIRARDQERKQWVEKHNAGETLPSWPAAGLCGFCQLNCEKRQAFQNGELMVGPIQNREDAVRAAEIIKAMDGARDQLRNALLAYVDVNGPIRIGGDFVARPKVVETKSYRLPEALDKLGLLWIDASGWTDAELEEIRKRLPAKSPIGDIPLNSLKISGMTSFLDAKKRAELKEEFGQIAKRSTYTTLDICKDPDLVNVLEASLAQLEGNHADDRDTGGRPTGPAG